MAEMLHTMPGLSLPPTLPEPNFPLRAFGRRILTEKDLEGRFRDAEQKLKTLMGGL